MRHTHADETRSFRFSARRVLTDLEVAKAGVFPMSNSVSNLLRGHGVRRMAGDWLPDTPARDRRGAGSAG